MTNWMHVGIPCWHLVFLGRKYLNKIYIGDLSSQKILQINILNIILSIKMYIRPLFFSPQKKLITKNRTRIDIFLVPIHFYFFINFFFKLGIRLIRGCSIFPPFLSHIFRLSKVRVLCSSVLLLLFNFLRIFASGGLRLPFGFYCRIIRHINPKFLRAASRF